MTDAELQTIRERQAYKKKSGFKPDQADRDVDALLAEVDRLQRENDRLNLNARIAPMTTDDADLQAIRERVEKAIPSREFIARPRQEVPALLAEVERLRTLVRRVGEASARSVSADGYDLVDAASFCREELA